MSIPLGKTVGAMAAGLATVSLGSAIMISTETSKPPQFAGLYSKGTSRYSQSEFKGRYKKMFLACDPTLLLNTEADFRAGETIIADFKSKYDAANGKITLTDSENEALWNTKRIVDSAIHQDTKETIPPPFRMSGFLPFNGPISVAMIASSTTPALLFWAWTNQSQNALVNYFNRNASSPMSNETLAQSYGTAVGSALTLSFGLSTIIKKRCSAETATKMMKFVAFPASVLASSLNCYIVRSPEIVTGVPLLDNNNAAVLDGHPSSIAAKKGVLETTASRAILQVPVYFIPPVLAATVFGGFLAANPVLSVPVTTYLLLVSFGFGLPFAIAVFPQFGEIECECLEEEFKHLVDKDGEEIVSLTYNKGL